MTCLQLRGVSKAYDGVNAVEAIDLTVAAGSRIAIVGPSGSGKTTLLRLIAGFEEPDTGTIVFDGRTLVGGEGFVPAHRRGIGIVSQDGALFPHLTVAENIAFGLDRRAPDREKQVLELMRLVELDPTKRRQRPHELSGGQQQRVALARALARRPRLMLLDEPFSALDTGLREAMRDVVARVLGATGITALLVTHDQAEALSFADQLALLRDGRLIHAGVPQDLYLKPRDPEAARFLGEAIILPARLGENYAECCLGRIPAPTGARRGQGEIMIRPEQLEIIALPDEARGDDTSATAEVVNVKFGGAVSTIHLEISPRPTAAPDSPALAIRITMPSSGLPAVGRMVGVLVRGEAHVFDPAPHR